MSYVGRRHTKAGTKDLTRVALVFATQPFLQLLYLQNRMSQNVSECLTVIASCLESCRAGGVEVRHFSTTVAAAVELVAEVRNVLLCDNERIVYA